MTTTLSQREFHRFERMAVRMFGRIQDKTFAVLVPQQNGTTLTMRQDDGILSLRVDCNVTESIVLPWPLVKEAAVNRDGFIELDRGDTQIIMKHEIAGIPRQSRFSIKGLEAPDIPAAPDQMADVAAEPLLGAMVACGKCIDRDSDRYALGYIALHGKNGTIAATDGRQALLVDGFSFPWDEEVLLPSSRLFAAKELREHGSVRIGCRDKWVSIVSGDFTIRWKSFDGRFPKVENIIPNSESMTSWVELNEQDASFAMKRIDNMPGEKDEFRPVTLDLNGHVAIRSADRSGTNAAELQLVNSTWSGSETRVSITRDFLKHALAMGLKRIGLDGSERPLMAVDDKRRYVWMPLTSEPVLRTDATTVVTSANVNPAAIPVPKTTAPKIRDHAPSLVTAAKVIRPTSSVSEDRTPLDEAESIRDSLRTSLGQVNILVRSLKTQMRQNRQLRATLASIKRLQSLEA